MRRAWVGQQLWGGAAGIARRLGDAWATTDRLLTRLAVVVGLVTGLWAIGFSWLIDSVRDLYYHHGGQALATHGLFHWLLPLLPMSGALLVGMITWRFAPEAEGHGVPEVMDAMARRGGRIRPRIAGAKAVASALTIGSGGSAGTEGPIIQIGAAIGSGIGQWLRLGLPELRVLIGCGAAAGIAAIFRAPIAGVLFAVEVLLRDVSLRSFVPIIMSAVVSSTVTLAVRGGNSPLFPVPHEFLTATPVYRFSLAEVANYAVLGVCCGFVAWIFVKWLYAAEDLFRKLPIHRVWRPVIGAALLGVLAAGSDALTNRDLPRRPSLTAPAATVPATKGAHQPAIMGNGYPLIGQTLEPLAYGPGASSAGPTWTPPVLLILLAAKILATGLTLGSGGSGGVFAPSLFIGATTGGTFGLLVQATGWFPDVTPGAYALVGMAAVVAASIHAPLTATLMLFELTGDYEVIVPIMLAGILGLGVARRLEPASIYTLKLLRRGVDLHRGQDVSLLRHVKVRDVMRPATVTIAPGAGVLEVVSKFVAHPGVSLFVTGADGRLLGVISGPESRCVLADVSTFQDVLIARDLMRETGYPAAGPDDTLADVLKRLAAYRGEVPVLDGGRLVGVIWPEDVIAQYNAELFRRDMAAGMAAALSPGSRSEPLPAVENTSLAQIGVPPGFVGRSLGSLDIRSRYGVTVLLVQQARPIGPGTVNTVPTPAYQFGQDDILLVMGPKERLEQLARGDTRAA